MLDQTIISSTIATPFGPPTKGCICYAYTRVDVGMVIYNLPSSNDVLWQTHIGEKIKSILT